MLDLNKIDFDSLSYEKLEKLVESSDTSKELIIKIYNYAISKKNKDDFYIMGKIALHTNTPPEILSRMLNDNVIVSLISSARLNILKEEKEYLRMMSRGYDDSSVESRHYQDVSLFLLQNSHTLRDTLDTIWLKYEVMSPSVYGRQEFDYYEKFVKHPNTSGRILSKLYNFSEYTGVVKEVVDVLADCHNLRQNLTNGVVDGKEIVEYITKIEDVNLRKIVCSELVNKIDKNENLTSATGVISKIEEIIKSKVKENLIKKQTVNSSRSSSRTR